MPKLVCVLGEAEGVLKKVRVRARARARVCVCVLEKAPFDLEVYHMLTNSHRALQAYMTCTQFVSNL